MRCRDRLSQVRRATNGNAGRGGEPVTNGRGTKNESMRRSPMLSLTRRDPPEGGSVAAVLRLGRGTPHGSLRVPRDACAERRALQTCPRWSARRASPPAPPAPSPRSDRVLSSFGAGAGSPSRARAFPPIPRGGRDRVHPLVLSRGGFVATPDGSSADARVRLASCGVRGRGGKGERSRALRPWDLRPRRNEFRLPLPMTSRSSASPIRSGGVYIGNRNEANRRWTISGNSPRPCKARTRSAGGLGKELPESIGSGASPRGHVSFLRSRRERRRKS